MTSPTLWFFGSFGEHSAHVLQMLFAAHQEGIIHISGVATTPALPAGRKRELKKTDVQLKAEEFGLPVVTPTKLTSESLAEVIELLGQPDLLVTVGYGKLLPESWLAAPKTAALNLHFSLLPKYRGANPAEWALLAGETQTGVTLIEMSPEFDTGRMVAQAATAITADDTRETVYAKLYELGGQVLPEMLLSYAAQRPTSANSKITYFFPPEVQGDSLTPYAKRFTRDDGFIDWQAISSAREGHNADATLASPLLQDVLEQFGLDLDAGFIERAVRALAGFPGVWTVVPTTKGEKRMKILSTILTNGKLQLQQVQIEGQSPATWNQVKNSLTAL